MAPQITRLRELTGAAELALLSTFNGLPPASIGARIASGELALLRADFGNGSLAYAIVSRAGNIARIEALAGAGGMYLGRRILEAARAHGLRCDAWVKSKAMARLVGRVGMSETGEVDGRSGQLRVIA